MFSASNAVRKRLEPASTPTAAGREEWKSNDATWVSPVTNPNSSVLTATLTLSLVFAIYVGLGVFLDLVYINAAVDSLLVVTICLGIASFSEDLRNLSSLLICGYIALNCAINRQVLGVAYSMMPGLPWDMRIIVGLGLLNFCGVEFIMVVGFVAAFGPQPFADALRTYMPAKLSKLFAKLMGESTPARKLASKV